MSEVKTEHPYIVKVKDICGGNPIVKGTRIPVWIIADWFKRGYPPELIQKEIYPHLALAQIYDALSYYYDYQKEIEKQIEENNPSEKQLEQYRQQWEKLRNSS